MDVNVINNGNLTLWSTVQFTELKVTLKQNFKPLFIIIIIII